MRGKILSINIGTKKDIPKRPVKQGNLKEDWGLVGDVHSGPGDRQVSLLTWESIRKFSQKLKPNFRRSPVHKHSLPTERHFSKSKCVTDTFSSSSVGEPDENWRSAEVGLKDKKLRCPKIKSDQKELKPGDFAENITTQK